MHSVRGSQSNSPPIVEGVHLPHLRAVRHTRGLSRRALAMRSGVSLATIARLESGQAGVRRSTLTLLAEALEVLPAALSGQPMADTGGAASQVG